MTVGASLLAKDLREQARSHGSSAYGAENQHAMFGVERAKIAATFNPRGNVP